SCSTCRRTVQRVCSGSAKPPDPSCNTEPFLKPCKMYRLMALDEVKSLTPLSFGNETKAGEVPKKV
ncbi:hypothetical protein NQZ68_014154, partial [Dissostichus eleginoides]